MPYDTVVPASTRDDDTSSVNHTTDADTRPGTTDTPDTTGGVTSGHAVVANVASAVDAELPDPSADVTR